MKKIDAIPTRGARWFRRVITVAGDLLDGNNQPPSEEIEFWHRDPIECIRELISNPTFRDKLAFAPERVYADPEGSNRIYDEMWTADWWWDIQVRLSLLISRFVLKRLMN